VKEDVELIKKALDAARDSLDWWLVIGPYFEGALVKKTEEEIAVEVLQINGSSTAEEDAIQILGEHYRAQLLEQRKVTDLRKRECSSVASQIADLAIRRVFPNRF
jgi:hypothetical protein